MYTFAHPEKKIDKANSSYLFVNQYTTHKIVTAKIVKVVLEKLRNLKKKKNKRGNYQDN